MRRADGDRRGLALVQALRHLVALSFGAVLVAADPVVASGSTDAPADATLASELRLTLADDVTLVTRLIPAGGFLMGSPRDEAERVDIEGRPHALVGDAESRVAVTISRPLYLGTYEVTVAQYRAFATAAGKTLKVPEQTPGDHPMVQVTWQDTQDFCAWASTRSGMTVTLPSEAEWEYACRAGSSTRFCFGDDASQLGEYAWFKGNSGGSLHPVGQKRSNAWGLYDLHGNAWEWCQDLYAEGGLVGGIDPQGAATGTLRVRRGGGWNDPPFACRSAFRGRAVPDASAWRGFRVVVRVP
jgi:formylglycine-generating enzyme required for sulfatase activity